MSFLLGEKITKYKKMDWIQYERILVMAMKGDVLGFQAATEQLKTRPHKADGRLEIIQKFDFLYRILFENSTEKITYNKTNLVIDNLINLLINKNDMESNAVISAALLIYSSEQLLYKSIAATILSKEYLEKDINTSNLYLSKAKELAPSQDILHWVNNQ